MGAPPNQFAVPVHGLDAMQRDGMDFAFAIFPFKNTMAVFGKLNVGQRFQHNAMLDTVVIADPKFRPAEFFIPAYAIEQVLNGQHD